MTQEEIEDIWKHNKVNNPNSYDNGDEIQFDHDGFVRFCNKYFQKPTWSEEDEKFFITALWHISYSISNGKSSDIHCDTTDWLKSIKERYTWKPSVEQITALRWILNNIPYCKHKEEISGLLDQIKNL